MFAWLVLAMTGQLSLMSSTVSASVSWHASPMPLLSTSAWFVLGTNGQLSAPFSTPSASRSGSLQLKMPSPSVSGVAFW